ncbi:MAG: hypothetical protein ACYDBJ_18345 [Aggregatilineales bacterium]
MNQDELILPEGLVIVDEITLQGDVRAVVEAAAPQYVIMVLDMVNFEQPYAEQVELTQ